MSATEPALSVERLSKLYRLWAEGRRTDSLRDLLTIVAKSALWGRPRTAPAEATFWALKDVSMDISVGEVVGLIGRNGAGKSTLLKVLSRITSPTRGRAVIRGRVGSLLEVGAGFHPELTGRENLFLNGAIRGLSRAEVHRRLDAIVDFSGVSAFIDTPIKRYSSGMRVRLAFSMAAHLEPDILIVDEVLGVGDAPFQRRSLAKLAEIARNGRTILFVSHDMNLVLDLCHRAIVLERGAVVFDGTAAAAVRYYGDRARPASDGYIDLDTFSGRPDHLASMIKGLELRAAPHSPHVRTGQDVVVDIHYNCGTEPIDVVQLEVSATTGRRLLTVGTHLSPHAPGTFTGQGVLRCVLPAFPLAPGEYDVSVGMFRRIPWHELDYVESAMRFRVIDDASRLSECAPPDASGAPIAQRAQWSVTDRRDVVMCAAPQISPASLR